MEILTLPLAIAAFERRDSVKLLKRTADSVIDLNSMSEFKCYRKTSIMFIIV